MKRILVSLGLAAGLLVAPGLASAKVNPCLQAPVSGSAQSYRGCNFVKLGANAPSFAGADLSGFDFSFANMKGLNLAGANLAGAKLNRANLSGANLAGATITGSTQANPLLSYVNFGGGANLAGATFAGSYTLFTNWSGADLTNADFTGVFLDRGVLAGAKMDGTILAGVTSQGVSISKGNNLPPGYILRKGVIYYCSSKYRCDLP